MRSKSSAVADSELCIIKYREKSEQKNEKRQNIEVILCRNNYKEI